MKRSLLTAFLALSLASLTGCGPLFFVEAELPLVCKTFPDQPFMAAPPGYSGELSFPPMEMDFGQELPDFFDERLEGTLNVLSAELIAKSGVSDLGFIDEAHMDLVPSADSGLEPVRVVNYSRDPAATAPTSIELVDPSHPDVFPFLRSGAITGSLSLSGTLPSVDWSADLRMCVSAKGKLQYL